jgi:hypothetical protein
MLFQCELLSKGPDPRLYWPTIRPVVTKACEARVLMDNIVQKVMRFERKKQKVKLSPSSRLRRPIGL